jgi:hypothetical protein
VRRGATCSRPPNVTDGRTPAPRTRTPDDSWPAFQLLEFWSEQWRAEHGAEYGQRPTIASEANFLRHSLNWAWDHEVHWDDFAADIRRARLRLEDIVYAGRRVERTRIVCDKCEAAPRLIKIRTDDPTGEADYHKCPGCKHRFTTEEFQRANAKMLYSEGADRYVSQTEAVATLVSQGRGLRTVRRWLAPPVVEEPVVARREHGAEGVAPSDFTGEAAMRLTLSLLGLELDLSFGLAGVDAEEADPLRDLGTTGHYPVSFVGSYEGVDECSLPMRNNGWGDEENRR